MKNYFILLALIFFSYASIGQDSYSQFKNETDIREKAEIAYNLLNEYSLNDLDSLRLISTELILLAKKNRIEYALAIGQFGIGSFYLRSGEQEKAIASLKSALVYFKSIEDYQLVSEIFNEIGNSYMLAGEYTNAIESFISSIDFGSISRDPTAAFNGEIGLAKAYFSLGDTLKGESAMRNYIKQSIKHEKYKSLSNAYSYLGMVEQDKGDKEASFRYLDKSIFYGLKANSKIQLSHVYTNKAILFFTDEVYDSSLIYFQKALDLRLEIKNYRQICESYFNLASYYIERGELEKAIVEINHSIDVARAKNLLQDEYDGIELLEFIYGEMGDSISEQNQTKLLANIKLKMEDKKKIDKELLDYIDEVESSVLFDVEDDVEQKNENNSWMMVAGIFILIIAGFVMGRSVLNIYAKSKRN